MNSKSIRSLQVQIPSDAAPTVTASSDPMTFTAQLDSELLLEIANEARKFGVPVDEFVSTLIDCGMQKWRECESVRA